MSATNNCEDGLLSLIFENANYANIGDSTGLRQSSTAGVFYISLHTGTINEANITTQAAQEAAYTSYARVSVARSTSGWTVTSGTVDNDAPINFPPATGGSETETGFGIGAAASGSALGAAGLQFWGALTAGLAVSNGITPSFAIGALDVTLD